MSLSQTQQLISLPQIANKSNSASRNKIPIVQHIIKDNDISQPEGEKLEPVDFERIIKLFIDPHSHHMFERHVHCIKKIVKQYRIGFLIKDVVKIIKILNILADKCELDEGYLPCMCDLLDKLQYPFVKDRASDEVNYESVIADCMANLGYLFRTPNAAVRLAICVCIYNLITFKNVPNTVYANLQRCSKEFLRRTIRASDLSETLVKSLTLMEDDLEMRLKMMRILQLLSKSDSCNCEQMLDAECANRLVLKMNYPNQKEEVLFRSLEILWNLLENGSKEKVALQLNSHVAISQLRDAFLWHLLQGCSNYDRQVRNDILIMSIQIVSALPTLPFIETGFAKELLLFGTFPEIKSHSPLTKNLKLTTCYEDFELKKLFFNFVVAIAKNMTSYQLLSESGILIALLSFIRPIESVREPRDWTVSQFEELQLHAMSTLCIIIPILMKDYFACHGSNRLLLFLEWCISDKDDYKGFGNSFHGKCGRGSKKAQLKYCLRVIRSIVSTGIEQAIQDLTDQGLLASLLNILQLYNNSGAQQDEEEQQQRCDEQIDVEIQSDILFVLSCVCENDMHRKELFGREGVDMLIKYLKKNPACVWNGLGYQRLIIGTIDCIWATVIGCVLNEDYFIQREGIFFLLDILEASPKSMQNLILGCLLDLSDNVKTLTHLLQWEGHGNQKISHFLCTLWREEEKEIGVQRDENGLILDTQAPLGVAQSFEMPPLPASVPSKAIVEVSENMRAKIYGLFCKLGFVDLPCLTQEDHLTLCIIENYLDFKLGEVFKEVESELTREGVQPIPPDQDALDTILRAMDDRAISVSLNQHKMVNTYKQQEIIQEKEFYYEMRKNHDTKEKLAKEWYDYVKRTSKYSHLLNSKDKQLVAIEDSRLPEPSANESMLYQTIHNLEIPNLAVTAFCGPLITIDSTPAEITGGRLKKMMLTK